MNKLDYFNNILPKKLIPKGQGVAYAPANIALSKYWGKRDADLNLPTNSSLSISLAHLGSTTQISAAEEDSIYLNDELVAPDNLFSRRVFQFVDYFRRGEKQPLQIRTQNTIPTAAGLASSASGFAALTLALADYWQLNFPDNYLSCMARIGSGSASRSLWHGFVKWQVGTKSDGSDSYAYPINTHWDTLRIALIEINTAKKETSSRNGMNHTAKTSPLFSVWPQTAENDLLKIENAIEERDFTTLAAYAENNALTMHATMMAARPALIYLQSETFATIARIHHLRREGLPLYFTMDAGPNIKLLYPNTHSEEIKKLFPDAIHINPFKVL